MQVGNRQIIAASYSTLDDSDDTYVYGSLSWFIGGEEVGNPDQIVMLDQVFTALLFIRSCSGRRQADELFVAPVRDVALSLDIALYCRPDTIEYTPVPLPKEPERFEISLPIGSFDNWRVYLIDGTDESRVIYFSFDWEEPREFRIPIGLADAMLEELSAEIEKAMQKPDHLQPEES